MRRNGFTNFGIFCAYFNSKTYDFENSITKSSIGALKRESSKVHYQYVYLNQNFENLSEFDTLIVGFLKAYTKINTEFNNNTLFDGTDVKSIFLFLDYLISSEFSKTRISKQLNDTQLQILRDIKSNTSKIYNLSQVTTAETSSVTTNISSTDQNNINSTKELERRLFSQIENMFKNFTNNYNRSNQTIQILYSIIQKVFRLIHHTS